MNSFIFESLFFSFFIFYTFNIVFDLVWLKWCGRYWFLFKWFASFVRDESFYSSFIFRDSKPFRERSMWHAIHYFANWINVKLYFSILKEITYLFYFLFFRVFVHFRCYEWRRLRIYSYKLIGSIDSVDSFWIHLCALCMRIIFPSFCTQHHGRVN